MPRVLPFRALRPSADLASRIAPPYDVIDASQRSRLQAASDRNVVHLTLPEGDDAAKYTVAASLLRSWEREGSLVRDDADQLTIYEQAGARTLRGVFAAVGVEEPADGGVLPHERTYDTIVRDRYDLLEATGCNLEPVFLLAYGATGLADAIDAATARTPLADVEALGARHRAWRIDDLDGVRALTDALSAATLVIADGHHRWRTAQRYAQAHPQEPGARSHLAFVADASGGGVAIEPIHRALPSATADEIAGSVAPVADLEPGPADPRALADAVRARRAHGRVFGLWSASGGHLVVMREDAPLPGEASRAWRDLDVAVLDETILRGLPPAAFAHDPEQAAAAAGPSGSAVLLAPPPIEAVRTIAEAGEAMPQKSTLFVPKPASGLVLRPLA